MMNIILKVQEMHEANYTYQFVRNFIGKFNTYGGKFHPFYKCISGEEIGFRSMPPRFSVILGFEVVNHVLAHLTGSTIKESNVDFTVATYFSKNTLLPTSVVMFFQLFTDI